MRNGWYCQNCKKRNAPKRLRCVKCRQVDKGARQMRIDAKAIEIGERFMKRYKNALKTLATMP